MIDMTNGVGTLAVWGVVTLAVPTPGVVWEYSFLNVRNEKALLLN